jgi:hypothetical protein
MATVVRKVEEETGYRPKQVKHLVSYQPMADRVDSEHVLFLVRGAELVGKPEGEVEADRIEWVPMAEIPGMIAPGDIWTAGTLIGPLQAQQRLNGRGRLTARRTNHARQGPVHKHGPQGASRPFSRPQSGHPAGQGHPERGDPRGGTYSRRNRDRAADARGGSRVLDVARAKRNAPAGRLHRRSASARARLLDRVGRTLTWTWARSAPGPRSSGTLRPPARLRRELAPPAMPQEVQDPRPSG